MNARQSHQPIVGREWNGQVHFKRTTSTDNLIPLASPFRWHERMMGQVIRLLSQTLAAIR